MINQNDSLCNALRVLSTNKNNDYYMLREWELEHIEEGVSNCECSKEIYYQFHIINTTNQNRTHIGSTCIERVDIVTNACDIQKLLVKIKDKGVYTSISPSEYHFLYSDGVIDIAMRNLLRNRYRKHSDYVDDNRTNLERIYQTIFHHYIPKGRIECEEKWDKFDENFEKYNTKLWDIVKKSDESDWYKANGVRNLYSKFIGRKYVLPQEKIQWKKYYKMFK